MRNATRKMKMSLDVVAARTFSNARLLKLFGLSKLRELSRPKTVESCDIDGVAGGDNIAMMACRYGHSGCEDAILSDRRQIAHLGFAFRKPGCQANQPPNQAKQPAPLQVPQ